MDIVMVIMGWLAHHLKVLMNMGQEGKLISPVTYIKQRPYKFILSIVGTVMGTIFLSYTAHPSINPTVTDGVYLALLAGVGFLGDMVADKFGSMAAKRMQ